MKVPATCFLCYGCVAGPLPGRAPVEAGVALVGCVSGRALAAGWRVHAGVRSGEPAWGEARGRDGDGGRLGTTGEKAEAQRGSQPHPGQAAEKQWDWVTPSLPEPRTFPCIFPPLHFLLVPVESTLRAWPPTEFGVHSVSVLSSSLPAVAQ